MEVEMGRWADVELGAGQFCGIKRMSAGLLLPDDPTGTV